MDDRKVVPDLDDNPEVQHETSDVNVRAIAKFALAFVIVTVVVHVVLYFMFQWMAARSERHDPDPISLAQPSAIRKPPAPNLQRLNTAPAIEIQQMRDREAQNLGLAEGQAAQQNRIPIEEAMRRVVQQGLPVHAAPQGAGATNLTPDMTTGFPAATPAPGRNEEVRPVMPPGPPQVSAPPQAAPEPNR